MRGRSGRQARDDMEAPAVRSPFGCRSIDAVPYALTCSAGRSSGDLETGSQCPQRVESRPSPKGATGNIRDCVGAVVHLIVDPRTLCLKVATQTRVVSDRLGGQTSMTELVRFYYRASNVAVPFIGISALSLFIIWSPFESRYFGFLQHYPGRAVIFAIVGIYVTVLVWLLPTVVRSIARIPAVEFDGRTLLVRGWQDRSFDTVEDDIRVEAGVQRISIAATGRPRASIPLRHIEGPASLVRFLNSLAVLSR